LGAVRQWQGETCTTRNRKTRSQSQWTSRCSPSLAVRYIHTRSSTALGAAVNDGLIARNPVGRANPPTALEASQAHARDDLAGRLAGARRVAAARPRVTSNHDHGLCPCAAQLAARGGRPVRQARRRSVNGHGRRARIGDLVGGRAVAVSGDESVAVTAAYASLGSVGDGAEAPTGRTWRSVVHEAPP